MATEACFRRLGGGGEVPEGESLVQVAVLVEKAQTVPSSSAGSLEREVPP